MDALCSPMQMENFDYTLSPLVKRYYLFQNMQIIMAHLCSSDGHVQFFQGHSLQNSIYSISLLT